jgi:hypothetical protein
LLTENNSNSVCDAEESCIRRGVPASLTASRFDLNSFRILSGILEAVNLSHYSGKYFNYYSTIKFMDYFKY